MTKQTSKWVVLVPLVPLIHPMMVESRFDACYKRITIEMGLSVDIYVVNYNTLPIHEFFQS